MRKLASLSSPPIQHFDAIVKDKKPRTRARLRGVRPLVSRRYRSYRAYAPRLEKFQLARISSRATRTALLKCYRGTAAYDALFVAIQLAFNQAEQSRCPYCGLNEAASIDHYLPKHQFPELAVCHWNMILTCTDCNTKFKGTQWRKEGKRVYLHPYFDAIDETRAYLHAAVGIRNKVPRVKYSVVMPLGGDPEFYDHYKRHCLGLKLFKRFAKQARFKLDEWRTNIQELAPNDPPQTLQQKLDKLARRRSRTLGANHWEAALLRAMASSPAVIRWCLRYDPTRPASTS